ncbi:MAG: acyl carrier protein [Planctomycetes bacterium]|nr:acyl carrier protein [Planctomycetota bacterium]
MSAADPERDLRGVLVGRGHDRASDIGLDDDLPHGLGLDSLASLRLLALVEKQFAVRFPDDQLAHYRTLRRIMEFIVARREESGP